MSLPLWVGGGPVRARCGGSSLAELYGLAWIVRVSCTVVVGVGALVGTQSRFVSEFPPSVRLTPATFPQGGRLIFGSCFAVAGIGGEVVGSLFMKASLPSLSLRDISPPRERLFFICRFCLCLLFPRGTAFFLLLHCSRWVFGDSALSFLA